MLTKDKLKKFLGTGKVFTQNKDRYYLKKSGCGINLVHYYKELKDWETIFFTSKETEEERMEDIRCFIEDWSGPWSPIV